MSYLDIMVLSAQFPTLFVTSVELQRMPVLGTIATMGGSIFVERRNRRNIKGEISAITSALKNGHSITLYPEGTSSDGKFVLPFKRSLFQSALDAKVPIQPLTLAYTRINGQAFGDNNGDLLCWYGNMTFLPHLLRLLTTRGIDVTLTIHPVIYPHPDDTRITICDYTHRLINREYARLIST